MAQLNPQALYQNTAVNSSSPTRLVVLLYEGAIKRIRKGEMLLQDPEQFADAGVHLIRAMNIVTELLGALNPNASAELSERLSAIYSYVLALIGQALEERNPAPLGEAAKIMDSLGSAWREIADGAC